MRDMDAVAVLLPQKSPRQAVAAAASFLDVPIFSYAFSAAGATGEL